MRVANADEVGFVENRKVRIYRYMRLIILALLMFSNCVAAAQVVGMHQANMPKEIGEKPISNIFQSDTLTLLTQYIECGEWGGHREEFKIYNEHNGEKYAFYTKDSVDCKSEIERQIIVSKKIKLTEHHKTLIVGYVVELGYKSSLFSPPISNATMYFSASSSDHGLVVSYTSMSYAGFDALTNELLR